MANFRERLTMSSVLRIELQAQLRKLHDALDRMHDTEIADLLTAGKFSVGARGSAVSPVSVPAATVMYEISITARNEEEHRASTQVNGPILTTPSAQCDHGVYFDEEAARGLEAGEVKKRWPRLSGHCPKGCGFFGTAYVSNAHFVMGDW